jgi:hypothetical protein
MAKIKWVNLIPYPNHKGYAVGNHVVYLVYAASFDLHKIGWTEDLKERLKTMERDQRDIPGPYKAIHTIETDSGPYLERQLHLLFRHHHSVREWFRLTKADVQWIRKLGISLPNGIPLRADVVPPLAEWSD